MAITRFAPSPTGFLHIGGLRTALYNYLWAKKTKGEFKLRIEDTDQDRNNQKAVAAILDAFEWVGMPSDCDIEYQSKRVNIYKQYIDQLLKEGKAYKCYMSKEELDLLRKEQEKNKQTPRYDGRYRDFTGILPKDIDPVIRIKSPLNGRITFRDGIKGDMDFDASLIDDFVIARSNGMPTYNFVVAIDDHLMKITDVLRGDDHLTNTSKQIIIYNALNFKIPIFFHIPMINNSKGKKLSKRDGAMDVMEYKKLGYLPEAILNFLVRLGWSSEDKEIFSMDEMLELFDPNDINKSASSYNEEKLLWLNSYYIKNANNNRLKKDLENFDLYLDDFDQVNLLLDLCKERSNTLIELKASINNIINKPSSYDKKGVKKFIKENTVDILQKYIDLLESNKNNIKNIIDIEKITKIFIQQYDLKFPALFQPIRISLTGGTKAPSVFEIIIVLGIDESIKRIKYAISKNYNKEVL